MKNKPIEKKLLNQIALFSILLLLLNGIPHLSFSQDVPVNPPQQKLPFPAPQKSEPANIRPLEQDYHYIPSQNLSFPPDIVSPQPWDNQQSVAPSQKLTPEQIKKIVGNDKVLGKDAQGHQLYQNAKGETYYLSDNGTKMILK